MTVTDNGNGTLTAAVTYPDDKNKLDFVNDYDTKTVSVPIKGIKSLELEGEAAITIEDIEGKYDFALTGKETTAGAGAAAPMPTLNGKTMTSAKNDKTGKSTSAISRCRLRILRALRRMHRATGRGHLNTKSQKRVMLTAW